MLVPYSNSLSEVRTISFDDFQRYLKRCEIKKEETESTSSNSSFSSLLRNSLIASAASAILAGFQILDPIITKVIDKTIAAFSGGSVLIIFSAYFLGKIEKAYKKATRHLDQTANFYQHAAHQKLQITQMSAPLEGEEFQAKLQQFLTVQYEIDLNEQNQQNKAYYAFLIYILSGFSLFLGGALTCPTLTLLGAIVTVANSAFFAYAAWDKEELTEDQEQIHSSFINTYKNFTPRTPKAESSTAANDHIIPSSARPFSVHLPSIPEGSSFSVNTTVTERIYQFNTTAFRTVKGFKE